MASYDIILHKLFSFISIKWRGKPLTTYQAIVNLISATKNSGGLTVKARLDKKTYEKGIKVSEEEMNKFKIVKNKFHGV